MEQVKMWMLIVSVLGALIGIFFMANLHPLNNAAYFIAISGLVGIAVGNLVLLVLYEVYKHYYATPKAGAIMFS